jgi:phospholipid/cholesterol/gamma-HCH transport system substrate-binding protein
MQQTRSVELGTGLFVLLGLAALFFLTTQTTGSDKFSGAKTFRVSARFENVGSLKDRAPVAMSGVTIGRVVSVRFDPEQLNAEVIFEIDSQYSQIPDDSDASILTAGLLGSQYIGLQAGGSEEYLQEGSEILFTQSAIVIENLIGKYLFNQGADSSEEEEEEEE